MTTLPAASATSFRADDASFRILVESVVHYAILMLDLEGRVVFANRGAERVFGRPREEMLGARAAALFYPPAARGTLPKLLDIARRDGRAADYGWRLRGDGTRFWAHVNVTAMRDGAGQVAGYASITDDLGEQREADEALRESEARFRLLVESVRDYAIFMLDPDGRVATWNAGAERLKQYRASEIIGKHFSIFYPPEDVEAGKCELELAVSSEVGRFEDEGWRVRKDGTRFWANVVITALRRPDGELVGFAKVTRDLTERKAAEEERLRLAHAREAVRMRDEFLSIASHELRTPLASLDMQLQRLALRAATLDEKTAALVSTAEASSQRMVRLIDALLDVSRLSGGRFTLHAAPDDAVEIVRGALDSVREQAEDAGCAVTFDGPSEPLPVTWDALRVEQIVSNLVDNAVKYGARRPVHVSLAKDGDVARIEVADEGPGIPPEDLERIFGRFERASSMRHYGGMGLGLYVSRQIAEAHGGTIVAANRAGGGAVFTVRLPFHPTVPSTLPEEP